MVLLVLFTFCLAVIGCTPTPKTTDDSQGESYTDPDTGEILRYADGTYCAEVEYYYSKTGTRSTYTLSVEIEDNQLIRIDWPNGGWLDDTHFNPPDIEDGTAEFTSDVGVDYTVTILGEDGYCALSSSAIDEESLIDQQTEEEEQERVDAQNEEDRVREEEEQEDRDRREQERQTEEEEQNQNQ
ncbi:hypothetical protein [Pedobacter panaciterrae]